MNDQDKLRLVELQTQINQLMAEREMILLRSAIPDMDHNKILLTLMARPKMPMAKLAVACGWLLSNGKPYTAKVFRIVTQLEEHGLVKRDRKGKIRLTPKGVAKLIQKG